MKNRNTVLTTISVVVGVVAFIAMMLLLSGLGG